VTDIPSNDAGAFKIAMNWRKRLVFFCSEKLFVQRKESPENPQNQHLLDKIEKYMSFQRMKIDHFPNYCAHDSCWQILTLVFFNQLLGKNCDALNIAEYLQISNNTAMRYINILEESGILIEKSNVGKDFCNNIEISDPFFQNMVNIYS
jgi:hypothetical protein